MTAYDVYPFASVNRAKGTRTSDNTRREFRLGGYGELMVQPVVPWRHSLCDEGSYHLFHNPTNDAATTLAGHAAPVLADADATMTKPFLFFRYLLNNATRLFLDWIEITVVTAGATGSTASWAAQLDTGTTRLSSGGTALTVVNPNMQASSGLGTDSLTILGGAPVVGAESSASRTLGHGDLRPSIEIAGDRKVFVFGDTAFPVTASAAAAVRTQVVQMPPVSLGYTDQFLLALYAPSQNAAGVYKVRGGMYVR